LDSVDRIAPGQIGLLPLAKSGWETDNIFVAYIDEFANEGHHKRRASFTFEDDQVTFEIWEDGTLV